jgi:hypothetical protein
MTQESSSREAGSRRLKDDPRSRLDWSVDMAQYFLHLRDSADEVLDPVGS